MSVMDHLKNVGTLFYVIDPYSTMFEKVSDIPKPDWLTRVSLEKSLTITHCFLSKKIFQGMPYFFVFVVLEHAILKWQGKAGIRLNDGLMSLANGIIMLMMQ